MKITVQQIAHVTGARGHNDAAAVATSVCIDSRRVVPGSLFVALPGQHCDGHEFLEAAAAAGAVAALVSKPDVTASIPLLCVDDVVVALAQLATYWRQSCGACRVVAITGSCGKTTTSQLVQHLLKNVGKVHGTEGNYNNHLGVPLTLLGLSTDDDFAVIEMGANHQGEIGPLSRMVCPDIAVITNIGEAHLEGFGGLAGVQKGKSEIIEGLAPNGTLVLNHDNELSRPIAQRLSAEQQLRWVGAQSECDLTWVSAPSPGTRQCLKFQYLKGDVFQAKTSMPGQYNAQNIALAITVALECGVSMAHVTESIVGFAGTDRRMTEHQSRTGATVLDDAYNANPTAMTAALEVLCASSKSKKILVMGDMVELGHGAANSHKNVGRLAASMGVNQLFAVGDLSSVAVQAFGDGGHHFAELNSLLVALLPELDDQTVVLIKGSNACGLSVVVTALTD